MNQAYLFNTGKNYMAYKMLGARPDSEVGYRFAVWAPRASSVSVVGDFNDWNKEADFLDKYGSTGIWIGHIEDAKEWDRYKYCVVSEEGKAVLKADPFARHSETRPGTASILYNPDDYLWQDNKWMANRLDRKAIRPLNIYEIHLGSWRRYKDGNCFNYREIADQLAEYLVEMGYNAVEIMPVSEYPFDASWGYQVTGYFSVTSRYGDPSDFKYLIDKLHQHDILVILDWVPGHFPKDEFGLANFDGKPLYEHPDTRLGEHKEWGTLVFDYSKKEVQSFLISNAWFWLDEFHIDGLRVDAVSSMLYLNYNRTEYIPNKDGGIENLDVIDFLQNLNSLVKEHFPHALMVAEESTSWPLVSTEVEAGGLGFSHKWNMGWMNDTLDYMSRDYIFRPNHHNQLTFSMVYAFSENFILPFSHDEVVHGKCSLLGRMPGDYWRKFASLRAMISLQMAHPGAKLNFMGNELAPFTEWRYYEELEWFMLQYPQHQQHHNFVKELNHFYLNHPAFYELDHSWDGFNWLQADDYQNSVYAFERIDSTGKERIVCVFNLTPKVHPHYLLKVSKEGSYRLVLNSDELKYGGSAYLAKQKKKKYLSKLEKIEDLNENEEIVKEEIPVLELVLPPLAAMYFVYEGKHEKKKKKQEEVKDG